MISTTTTSRPATATATRSIATTSQPRGAGPVDVDGVAGLGTILGVWAHPDDETYCTGGLMAAARAAGNRVVVATATRGESGTSDPVAWPPERLAAVREAEMAGALGVLGVDEHHWLGHADGACAHLPLDAGARAVAAIVRAVRPDTVVTFGPDGFTGHPDHRAVSRWTSAALARVADPGTRLLHQITTPAFQQRYQAFHQRFGVFMTPDLPPTCDVHQLAVHLELPPALLDRKVAALRAHASQSRILEDALGARGYREWVGEEWLRDAAF